MMAVITNAYSNVVSSFFSAKFQRHIEEMLVSPLPNAVIVLGFVGGGVARGLAVGAVVTGVLAVFRRFALATSFIHLAGDGPDFGAVRARRADQRHFRQKLSTIFL
jgi:hypothetical protein